MNSHGSISPSLSFFCVLYISTNLPSFRKTMKPSNMINLTRPSKHKHKHAHVIGRFKHDAGCKKHPKHHQSPGVCSLCLREKLTQLSASTSRAAPPSSAATSSSVSSLSSYYSSSSASSCASPTEANPGSSMSIFLFSSKHGLIKSRSVAFLPGRRDAVGEDNKTAKKRGFLFNLLRPRNKRMEDKDTNLVRCGSVRENVAVAS